MNESMKLRLLAKNAAYLYQTNAPRFMRRASQIINRPFDESRYLAARIPNVKFMNIEKINRTT